MNNKPTYEELVAKLEVADADLKALADLINSQSKQIVELIAKVERLRSILIDKTAQPTCCGLGVGDQQSGFSCCGNPEFSWPDDVVEVLIETTSNDGSVSAPYAIKGEVE